MFVGLAKAWVGLADVAAQGTARLEAPVAELALEWLVIHSGEELLRGGLLGRGTFPLLVIYFFALDLDGGFLALIHCLLNFLLFNVVVVAGLEHLWRAFWLRIVYEGRVSASGAAGGLQRLNHQHLVLALIGGLRRWLFPLLNCFSLLRLNFLNILLNRTCIWLGF